ncbi:unnamed protein product [Cuscuta campestris]|uniref:DUF4283 domain-containing protein n=1 Tax=Cuscuta campestris TaxID=132261 RepID=A0A484LFF0_9ASTE|nr:unnamed protein product [Cuscuta campestris]
MDPNNIDSGIAAISLDNEEDDGLIFGDEIEDSSNHQPAYDFCLVGQFLTDRPVNFVAMKNTMASLWRPEEGMVVKEVGPDPSEVPLHHLYVWVQVYGLKRGFFSERVAQRLGNEIGHGERFCPETLRQWGCKVERKFGPEMRASTRRASNNIGARWLREELPPRGDEVEKQEKIGKGDSRRSTPACTGLSSMLCKQDAAPPNTELAVWQRNKEATPRVEFSDFQNQSDHNSMEKQSDVEMLLIPTDPKKRKKSVAEKNGEGFGRLMNGSKKT